MSYVDGFLLCVPKKNLKAYRKIAARAGKIWREHGALEYIEAVGDDLKPGFGVPFSKVARPRAGETVLFSFIVYRSRAHRDAVNRRVMKDKRLSAGMDEKKMPFDPKRMAWGGFKSIVDV